MSLDAGGELLVGAVVVAIILGVIGAVLGASYLVAITIINAVGATGVAAFAVGMVTFIVALYIIVNAIGFIFVVLGALVGAQ